MCGVCFPCYSLHTPHPLLSPLYHVHKSALIFKFYFINVIYQASQVVLVVKNLPAKAGNVSNAGSIPGWGRWVQSLGGEDPLEKEMTTHSRILAWRIPWTEEPSGLQSMGVTKQSDRTKVA